MPAGKRRILVADDDPQLLKLMKLKLQFESYSILMAQDGEQALALFEDEEPDMLILDIGMPGMNGFEVCQRVREFSAVPIIFITAREQMHDKLKAFSLGADDFLTKPFAMEELLARVSAVFRRTEALTNEPESMQSRLTVAELTIHYTWRQVLMSGRNIDLTPIEYSLISYLARHVGHVLTHYQLLEHIWSSEYVNDLHTLQVNINRLRRKLEPDPSNPCYILTKPGVGYMLSAHPQLAQIKALPLLEHCGIYSQGSGKHEVNLKMTQETLSQCISETVEELLRWDTEQKKQFEELLEHGGYQKQYITGALLDLQQHVGEHVSALLSGLQESRRSMIAALRCRRQRGTSRDEREKRSQVS